VFQIRKLRWKRNSLVILLALKFAQGTPPDVTNFSFG